MEPYKLRKIMAKRQIYSTYQNNKIIAIIDNILRIIGNLSRAKRNLKTREICNK